MEEIQSEDSTYTVSLARSMDNAQSATVEISVYDDDRDLQAFFEGSDDEAVLHAITKFHSVEALSPDILESKPNAHGVRNFSLANNPPQEKILIAVNAAVQDLEARGFKVQKRVNGWL